MGRELRRGSQRGGSPADSRRRVGFVSSSRPGRPGRESSSTRRRIPLTTTKKRGAMTRLLRPMHALLLQTDCKRPACNEPSDGVTRRHMASREDARRGLVWGIRYFIQGRVVRSGAMLRSVGRFVRQQLSASNFVGQLLWLAILTGISTTLGVVLRLPVVTLVGIALTALLLTLSGVLAWRDGWRPGRMRGTRGWVAGMDPVPEPNHPQWMVTLTPPRWDRHDSAVV